MLTARPQHWLLLLSSLASVALFAVVTAPRQASGRRGAGRLRAADGGRPGGHAPVRTRQLVVARRDDHRLPHLTVEPPPEEEQPAHAPGPALV